MPGFFPCEGTGLVTFLFQESPNFPSSHAFTLPPTQHNSTLRWSSKWYRRMLTSGCWQCVSQMANTLTSSFFKIKGSILKPVKRILENWSEHNKVNRLSYIFILYCPLLRMDPSAEENLNRSYNTIKFSLEFHPHKNHNLFLAHMFSSEHIFICKTYQYAFWCIYCMHYLQVSYMKAK